MKKSVVLILGLLISSVILSSLVLAQNSGMSGAVNSIGDIVKSIYNAAIEPLAKFLIGTDSAGDATKFFTLILFFVLLVSLLWEITEKVPFIGQNNWVQFIVSFGIAAISVRFLGQSGSASWFETILLPNQALGLALLCLLPLVIYFFFVMDVGVKSPTLAKILWIFAAVLFAILYLTRVEEIGRTAAGKFNPANIYLIAALVSFAFLLFDGTIRKWWRQIQIERTGKASASEAEIEIRRRLTQVNADITNNVITADEADKIKAGLKKKLKYFLKA